MEYSKKLSDFCHAIKIEGLPPEVIHKAKLCILDYIANVYGSLQLEATKNVAAYFRSLGGPEEATVHGLSYRLPVGSAAFINGTSAEAIESQDGLRFGGNHPGTAVIPTAFACTEKFKKTGGDLLSAVVAGYEAADRAAASVHPRHTLSGFLPTGTCGTFGAAVAAARLMGLDKERVSNASATPATSSRFQWQNSSWGDTR